MKQETPSIPMQSVSSSNIDKCGHDPVTNTLAVQFSNGGTYHYDGVSVDDFKALSEAKSIGKHFHSNIRSIFKSKKV